MKERNRQAGDQSRGVVPKLAQSRLADSSARSILIWGSLVDTIGACWKSGAQSLGIGGARGVVEPGTSEGPVQHEIADFGANTAVEPAPWSVRWIRDGSWSVRVDLERMAGWKQVRVYFEGAKNLIHATTGDWTRGDSSLGTRGGSGSLGFARFSLFCEIQDRKNFLDSEEEN